MIGAGGLGGPVAYALAAAGVSRIVICDPDRVDLGNLQRQVQFTTADVGRPKSEAIAAELVRRGYPSGQIRALPIRFAAENADQILDGVDLLIEASDDPATKFLANDQAVVRRLRFAIGAVERSAGHVFAGHVSPCYRCLFEDPPAESAGCAEAGVLGAAVAVIGGLLVRVALALAGNSDLAGQLWVVDDVGSRSPPRRVRYNPRRGCPACRT